MTFCLEVVFQFRTEGQLALSEDTLVSELRERIAEMVNMEPKYVRLVVSGKVLQEDSFTLREYGIISSNKVYVTKLAVNNAAGPSSPVKPVEPESSKDELLKMMSGNPMFQELFSSPELMEAILMSNPQFKEMTEKNPELGHLFKSKKFLQEMAQNMSNPARMKEMMRSADTAMARLDTIPGGFDAMRQLYGTMNDASGTGLDPEKVKEDERKNEEMAKKLKVESIPKDRVNDVALPNPWSPTGESSASIQAPPASNSNFLPFGFQPFMFGPPQINSPVQPSFMAQPQQNAAFNWDSYKIKYSNELKVLNDMGFTDDEKCLRALLASGGSVEAALNLLFSNQQ